MAMVGSKFVGTKHTTHQIISFHEFYFCDRANEKRVSNLVCTMSSSEWTKIDPGNEVESDRQCKRLISSFRLVSEVPYNNKRINYR